MRSENARFNGRNHPTLLSTEELALPAVCGQTGKPFLMVARRSGRASLELVRSVAIGFAESISSGLVRSTENRATYPRSNHGDANGEMNQGTATHRNLSFRELKMSAEIDIGSDYEGCPYCHASGYFHCSKCEMFSCWESHNERPHLDHTDVWCQACLAWRCTSDDGDGDKSSEVIGFALCNSPALQKRSAGGAADARQIQREASIRGYLK